MKKIFTIARGVEETLELKIAPRVSERKLVKEGHEFGEWLLGNSSSSFLRGLASSLDEAEIRKKVGLGY